MHSRLSVPFALVSVEPARYFPHETHDASPVHEEC